MGRGEDIQALWYGQIIAEIFSGCARSKRKTPSSKNVCLGGFRKCRDQGFIGKALMSERRRETAHYLVHVRLMESEGLIVVLTTAQAQSLGACTDSTFKRITLSVYSLV